MADYFVYAMMALNASAGVAYLYQGLPIKALYWAAAFTLNFCVLQMRG